MAKAATQTAARPAHAAAMGDLYDRMQSQHLAPLWDLYQNIVTRQPVAAEPSHLWSWRELVPTIERSAEAVKGELADHRVLLLRNPHIQGRVLTTTNIVSGIQCVMPGEKTIEHRHSASACRLILEGRGGSTFVDGKRCRMNERDFIITPNWTWHNHHNDSDARAIWIDILDAPLARYLDANFGAQGPADGYPAGVATLPDAAFGSGLAPAAAAPPPYSPRFHWNWADVAAALAALPRGADGSRRLRYTNPLDGGPVMPTLDAWVWDLAKARETQPYRSTANALCIVLEGEGGSTVGEATHRWSARDIFTLPHWSWVAHRAASEPARLLIVSDRDVLRRLGLLREETR